MTIRDLMPQIGGELLTEGSDVSKDISSGYACDLLSWVMARGLPGMAWVTVGKIEKKSGREGMQNGNCKNDSSDQFRGGRGK